MTTGLFDKSDIRKRLEKAEREIARRRAEDEAARANRPGFFVSLGRGFDRLLMEVAVHIPVGVAIVVSCFAAAQYGDFGPVFMAMSCALSLLLSRARHLFKDAERLDVKVFVAVLGFGAFCWEAYWVHLGLDRFNHQNAANNLQTFSDVFLIGASVMLGMFNVFSRDAFITGHARLGADHSAPESYYRNRARRGRFFGIVERSETAPPVSIMEAKVRKAEDAAVACFIETGAWPYGCKVTPELEAKVKAAQAA